MTQKPKHKSLVLSPRRHNLLATVEAGPDGMVHVMMTEGLASGLATLLLDMTHHAAAHSLALALASEIAALNP